MIINIGHNIADRANALSHSGLVTLVATFAPVTDAAIAQSATERTSVIQTSRSLSETELVTLARLTQQDAIAALDLATGRGALRGPKAAEWGPFDPRFFLLMDGKPLARFRASV